jgi:hypothetical protein
VKKFCLQCECDVVCDVVDSESRGQIKGQGGKHYGDTLKKANWEGYHGDSGGINT